MTSLANNLKKHNELSGRYISMAGWFDQKIIMVGTIQSNRIGISPAIKETKRRENYSCEIYWRTDGKINLSGYVVDTSKKKKRNYCYFQRWNRLWRLKMTKRKNQQYVNDMTLLKKAGVGWGGHR